MKKSAVIRLGCLLCACLLLCGCSAQPAAPSSAATLPPVESKWKAPDNDVNQNYTQTVNLYLPSLDGARLLAVPVSAQLSTSRHRAQTLCELLFTHSGTDITQPVSGSVTLRLSETDPIEISGSVATVNLGAIALRLSHEQLFTVGQALANTLCQFGDLEYVNVLIAGKQTGLDVGATLPAGCFQANTREDLGILWARASAPKITPRRAMTAALYYPLAAGNGVLCEARTLSFSSLSIPAMAETLLAALSAGAEKLPNMPRLPEMNAYLSQEPVLKEEGGKRYLALNFIQELNEKLMSAGIARSNLMAALSYTMLTFLPGLDGLQVYIGDEQVTFISPSGSAASAGNIITFVDGIIKRRDFQAFLLTPCTLYFPNEQGRLQAVIRPVSSYSALNPRVLLGQLMVGPRSIDSTENVFRALPAGLKDADLLGVSFKDRTLILNFSSQLVDLAQGMDEQQERLMVYSMVNTLCQLPAVEKVSFFILGRQPETFAGALYLPGDFMPNLSLVNE